MNGDGVLTGEFFMMGDVACAEGAISAGCRFFAGYPITPATEIAERMSERMPQIGGTYIQMEDELASMITILGASWGGVKAMTATSGPGFSLMMENLGLGIMTETPCVLVNVQRACIISPCPTRVGNPVEGSPRCTLTSTQGVSVMIPRPRFSIIKLNPGPEVAVMALTPPHEAPSMVIMEANSSSI